MKREVHMNEEPYFNLNKFSVQINGEVVVPVSKKRNENYLTWVCDILLIYMSFYKYICIYNPLDSVFISVMLREI